MGKVYLRNDLEKELTKDGLSVSDAVEKLLGNTDINARLDKLGQYLEQKFSALSSQLAGIEQKLQSLETFLVDVDRLDAQYQPEYQTIDWEEVKDFWLGDLDIDNPSDPRSWLNSPSSNPSHPAWYSLQIYDVMSNMDMADQYKWQVRDFGRAVVGFVDPSGFNPVFFADQMKIPHTPTS